MQTTTQIPHTLKKLVNHEYGDKPLNTDTVSIHTPPHPCQRPIHEARLTKWLKASNGINWSLFGQAKVVEYPTGERYIIDGQTRIQGVKWLLPDVTEVPAHIIHVQDDQEAADYFVKINSEAITHLNGEEILYAKIMAEDPYALWVKQQLDIGELACGMVNEDFTYRTKRSIFEKSLGYTPDGTQYAVELIRECWPAKEQIDGQLMCGLARLFSIRDNGEAIYADLMDPDTSLGKLFRNWMLGLAGFGSAPRDFHYNEYKGNGGWENGCQYGIYKYFLKYLAVQGVRYKAPAINASKLVMQTGGGHDSE